MEHVLLRVCDRDRDGRVGYDDFRKYMDDKELELYRIFQAIDVEHNLVLHDYIPVDDNVFNLGYEIA
ncbi:hypothetical protein GUJ93_ZPchr0009g721 [Zizania palustris]|uniref:EF-hand domain-containing protein n=1 Tax=Zizania palustris TaxID=103762 RepID=A0A8J5RPE7_ZIZPA|nr:hypothetical protein GUJ93_ZPchr0009g721 [Zizania palustris]